METAKYTLLHKPNVSTWPSVPRILKFALLFCVITFILCVIIFHIPRSSRLKKIYHVQATLVEIFNLEMEFINKDVVSVDNKWLPIEELDGHVYSAYFDSRPEVVDRYSYTHASNEITWALIRVIAILPTKTDLSEVDCIYKYVGFNNTTIFKRNRATAVEAIKDNWDLKYSAFFVICDLVVPEDLAYEVVYTERQLPSSITIARHQSELIISHNITSLVDVHYPTWRISRSYEMEERFMAICVPVLHHNFNRPLDLVEFVEYHSMLGANHFTFYNASVSPEVNKVLEYYVNRQLATVLPWKLPSQYVFEKTLRYEGLFAGLNDCLYRNSFNENYDYIGVFGIDEFLIPNIHSDFSDLMDHLDPVGDKGNTYASFVFRNAFFYTMYQDEYDNKNHKVPYLYTQAKTWRVKQPQEAGILSRYIVRGKNVIELGNYRVSELQEGSIAHYGEFDEKVVDPEVALLHRYSPCEAEETGCYLKEIEIDKTAHRFTRQLGLNVAAACMYVFGDASCPFFAKQNLA